MTEVYEADLTEFMAYREFDLLIELLKAYKESPIQLDTVKVGFNSGSGSVFLFDEDYNTFMVGYNEKLAQWHNCPDCGHEGFKEEFEGQDCEDCKRIFNGEFDYS